MLPVEQAQYVKTFKNHWKTNINWRFSISWRCKNQLKIDEKAYQKIVKKNDTLFHWKIAYFGTKNRLKIAQKQPSRPTPPREGCFWTCLSKWTGSALHFIKLPNMMKNVIIIKESWNIRKCAQPEENHCASMSKNAPSSWESLCACAGVCGNSTNCANMFQRVFRGLEFQSMWVADSAAYGRLALGRLTT